MEFSNRGNRQAYAGQPEPAPEHASHASSSGGHDNMKGKVFGGKTLKVVTTILLISVAILLVSLTAFTVFGGARSEDKYVNTKEFQAVFLNGGQVYFGKIRTLNTKFLTMDNIYYLRVNQQVQPNQSTSSSSQDISLAKLGCELHGPEDVMIINRDQVTFWENLKSDGQVVKAVSDFVKANPNGQTCTSSTGSQTTTPPATPPASSTTKKP